MRVVVVGGGVLGTMHALLALRRGHEVVQIERDREARGASVRNFGLIWVSGRAEGDELAAALRGRQLWEEIGSMAPGIGFRAAGSMTVIRTAAEFEVAETAMNLPSARAREFELVNPSRAREVNPALGGDFLGALWCRRDGVVEPRATQIALRDVLRQNPSYTWLPGREVRDVSATTVRDDLGESHGADVVVLCTGAWLGGLVRELAPELPVRRVRVQMLQTEPFGVPLETAVADADSFRYHPAYDSTRLSAMQPQAAVAERSAMQLLMVQRTDGALTIGDTHAYDEPFAFDVEEPPYKHLVSTAKHLLGTKLPKIRRRWSGVYSETVNGSAIVHRQQVGSGVWLVTGAGGRGMTCAPAIAEATLDAIGL